MSTAEAAAIRVPGFQWSPVASISATVRPSSSSQSRMASRSSVIDVKVRVSRQGRLLIPGAWIHTSTSLLLV